MPAQCVSNGTKPGDVKYTILYNKEKTAKIQFLATEHLEKRHIEPT